jgi:2-polyprenyl-3-methyl-5-hydroxy-6-metoxy-1,4-benzoquinol methylase
MAAQRRPPDEHYQHPTLSGIYDTTCGWSVDRDFYLSLATRPKMDILDIGCGTGLICDAYAAAGHRVTGVDPAASMLDIARKKPFGQSIDWVEAYAQDYDSDKHFDLIIMTGHAFQVLLTEVEVTALFETVYRHLRPSGKFVFESRNPEIDWASKWANSESIWPSENGRFHALTQILSTTRDHFV